jgi:(p)ppGpp synthase/HD superfamily hydrolase
MQNINCWESKFQACQYSDRLLNLLIFLNTMVRIPVDIKIIQMACYYARLYHGDQKRKSEEPYYSHPLIVAYLFALYVGYHKQIYYTTDLIAIAILHDTIEDTALTYDMIVEIFGKVIADGVKDLTRITDDGVKHGAFETLKSLYEQGKIGLLYVKLSDRLHNAMTLNFMKPTKQLSIAEETRDYFLPFAYKYELNELGETIREICAKIIYPNQPYLAKKRGFNSNCQLSFQVFRNGV